MPSLNNKGVEFAWSTIIKIMIAVIFLILLIVFYDQIAARMRALLPF